jgi:hypothetical protein
MGSTVSRGEDPSAASAVIRAVTAMIKPETTLIPFIPRPRISNFWSPADFSALGESSCTMDYSNSPPPTFLAGAEALGGTTGQSSASADRAATPTGHLGLRPAVHPLGSG